MSSLGKSQPQTIGTSAREERSSSAREPDTKSYPGDEDDDDRPAWSEMKTKAGKERKRLPLACIACRRKKIRCSGEKPACKHCSKARIPCVYKVTARKPAPRTDYMTMLDKRLKRMEDRVIKLAPEHDASRLAAIGRSSVKPYVAPAPKSATTKKRFAEDAFPNELNDWAGETAKVPPVPGPAETDARRAGLLNEGREHLPSPEIQEHLSEVYFDYLYGQSYHLLHKPSYMRKLKAGKVPPVLILTICALSARFSSHPQVNGEPVFLRGEEWAAPAREIALRRYDEPSITILIVYLLLGLHEFGTCQGGRSWMYGGMALRMAYALQLHHELDHNPTGRPDGRSSELSCTDREIRRRTMWACILMDRFYSSGTDRPMFAFEENLNIQLPVKEYNFQMEIPGFTEDIHGNVPQSIRDDPEELQNAKDNMGVAAYLIKVTTLWGKVIKYVNLGGRQQDQYHMWDSRSEFNQLRQRLKDYLEGLPERLQYTPETLQNHASNNMANQLILIHIICSQIALFLHKFAIPSIPGSILPPDAPKDFVSQSTKNAIEAAGRITQLVADAADYRVSAPFVGYCTFAASTVHVMGIFSSNASLAAISKKHLMYGIKYLTQMKRHWGMFHHMVENLRALYKQRADRARTGTQTESSSSKANETIFQYGDWFSKYPHGISGDEFGDPITISGVEDPATTSLYEKPERQSPEDFFHEAAKSIVPIPRKAARKQGSSSKTSTREKSKAIKKEPIQPSGIPDNNQLLRNLSLSPDTSNSSNSINNAQQATYTTNPAATQQQSLPLNPSFQQYPSSTINTYFPDPTQEMSAYTLNNQPLAMAELDRQLVFGAYGSDFSTPTTTSSPQAQYQMQNPAQIQTPMLQSQPQQQQQQMPSLPQSHVLASNVNTSTANAGPNAMIWDHTADYNAMNAHAALGAQSYQDGLSGSAWIVPFNIAPPNFGDGTGVGIREADMGNHGQAHPQGQGQGQGHGQAHGQGHYSAS